MRTLRPLSYPISMIPSTRMHLSINAITPVTKKTRVMKKVVSTQPNKPFQAAIGAVPRKHHENIKPRETSRFPRVCCRNRAMSRHLII